MLPEFRVAGETVLDEDCRGGLMGGAGCEDVVRALVGWVRDVGVGGRGAGEWHGWYLSVRIKSLASFFVLEGRREVRLLYLGWVWESPQPHIWGA